MGDSFTWAERRPWVASLISLALAACGGKSESVDGDRRGVTTAGAGGDEMRPDGAAGIGGNTASMGGNIAEMGGRAAGTGGSGAGVGGSTAGAPAATAVGVGDPDHSIVDSPNVGGTSPAFYWGSDDVGFRLGNWFVASPGRVRDARIESIEPPRGDSTLACHASGDEFSDAVDLFAQLDHPSAHPVDLSGYAGLGFWVRLNPPTAKLVVVLNPGIGVLLSEDSLASLPSASFAATGEWQHLEFPFADPEQARTVTSLDFVVLGGGPELDLWIDDLSLTMRRPAAR